MRIANYLVYSFDCWSSAEWNLVLYNNVATKIFGTNTNIINDDLLDKFNSLLMFRNKIQKVLKIKYKKKHILKKKTKGLSLNKRI